jgi:catechol 2,3-dioxygenase-like lactoylglutathione lyase family enzyme
MFKIGKLFHLTHVVSDLNAVDKWYDDVFSCQRFYRAYMPEAKRDASLVAISDFVMEPIMLAKVPGAENSPIGKFYARFGQHFHSIAWYADDIAGMSTELSKQNIRMYDLVGSPIKAPTRSLGIWTHPKDTSGLLEFAVTGRFSIDPRLHPAWSPAFWRERHPLGIERASHITVLVSDLSKARRLYVEVLRGKLLHEEEIGGRKRSAFIAVGEDTVVELAQPLSPTSPEGTELEKYGEGIYSVTFKTKDLKRASEFLQSKSQRIQKERDDTLVIGKNDTAGMVIEFTERQIPNDGR